MPNKPKSKTPQDKYKHSVFTAAQDMAYRKYRNQMALKGTPALPKQDWYSRVFKKKK